MFSRVGTQEKKMLAYYVQRDDAIDSNFRQMT